MNLPKTRAEAKAQGSNHYHTGKPCKRGHIAPRFASGPCVECDSGRYERRREKKLAEQKRWREANPTYRAEHQKKNSAGYAAHTASRKARQLQATPQWLTEDHLWMIEEIYDLAAKRSEVTGFKWHVDHEVPLNGRGVCGLHVPWNLQVIPAVQNLKKGNRYAQA